MSRSPLNDASGAASLQLRNELNASPVEPSGLVVVGRQGRSAGRRPSRSEEASDVGVASVEGSDAGPRSRQPRSVDELPARQVVAVADDVEAEGLDGE